MKKLLKEFLGEGKPSVDVHMRDGFIYADMAIEGLSNTAFRVRSKKGPVHLIQYDEVKQIKCESPTFDQQRE